MFKQKYPHVDIESWDYKHYLHKYHIPFGMCMTTHFHVFIFTILLSKKIRKKYGQHKIGTATMILVFNSLDVYIAKNISI